MAELQTMHPTDAVQMYLSAKRTEAAQATVKEHKYRLKQFLRWCELEGIDDMTTLNGRLLYQFRLWRRDDGNLKTLSLRNQLSCLRAFIRFCENVDAVEKDLHLKIDLPTVEDGEASKDTLMEPDRAKAIRTFLYQFKYASREHALFELLWHTGIRIGSAQSLDVEDFDVENERLSLVHRPETDTPLKNKEKGERMIALQPEVVQILSDYIEHNRPDKEDRYGRRPLFASTQGRCHKNTLRRTIYRCSQPCFYSGECPHDRIIEECGAVGYQSGERCPGSIEPHAIRRGAITHFLNSDIPQQVVEDRMNVSGKVLSKHYDKRTEEQKVELRRSYLNNI